MRRLLWIPWRWWRRAAQLALLLLFLWLFRRTEYSGANELSGAEHVFFHLDPLAALAPMLAARQLIAPLWPAAIVVAMTLILGRFFCGWVCPLGTLLDYFHRLLRPITRWTNQWSKSWVSNSRGLIAPGSNARYVVLLAVLLAAVFAFPLVGFVDPFSLLMRGMAFWGDPMLYRGADALLAHWHGHWGAGAVEPFVRKHLLPYGVMTFQWGGLSAAILATIFALELVARRFWCRYLCPTGAMLGLLGRRPLLKARAAKGL